MHYSYLWEDLSPAVVAARAQMQGPVSDCVLEASNALRVITKHAPARPAQRDPAVVDGGDDEDIVDVTAHELARKAAERQAQMIDLESTEWTNVQAPAGNDAAAAGGRGGTSDAQSTTVVRVKPEKVI